MDNTGKTTLLKQLAGDFGFDTRVSQKPTTHGAVLDWVRQQAEDQHTNIIVYDRFPLISEKIYGLALRGQINLPRGIEDYFKSYLLICPMTIFCRPPNEHIEDWGDRDQMKGVINTSHTLITLYDRMIMDYQERYQSPYLCVYDYTNPSSYAELKETVSVYIKRWKAAKTRREKMIKKMLKEGISNGQC